MKLSTLTIRNIASIEEAVIDFADPRWQDEPLFLIHGETGSGKSTILDAVCLALYKQTPRMKNGARDSYRDLRYGKDDMRSNSVIQYIRRGVTPQDEIYSQLSFLDDAGHHYTARCEFLLTRNNTLRGKGYSWTLLRDGSYVPEKEVEATIVEAVGLDFDQFCRTTMLAQGEFTKFLKAPEKEKTEILSKITDTEVFLTIGQRINERAINESTRLKEMRMRLEGMSAGLLTEDECAALRREIFALHADCATRQVLLSLLSEQYEWLRVEDDRQRALTETTMAYSKAQHDLEAETVTRDRLLLERWDATAEARVASLTVAKQTPELQRAQQTIDRGTTTLTTLLHEEAEAEKEMKQKKEVQDRCLAEMAGADTKRLADEKQLLLQRTRTLTRYNIHKENLTAAEVAAKSSADYLPTLRQAEAADREAQTLLTRMARSTEEFARTLRADLHEGDTCPVCGQPIATILHNEDFDRLLAPVREKQQQTQKALQEAQQEYNRRVAATQTADKLVLAAKAEYDKEWQTLQAIEQQTGLVSKDYAAVDVSVRIPEIDLLLAEAATRQKNYTEAKKAYEKAQTTFLTAQKKRLAEDTAQREAKSKVETLKPLITEAETVLRQAAEAGYPQDEVARLAAFTAQQISLKRLTINRLQENLNSTKGALDSASSAHEAHLRIRPVIAVGDTLERIADRIRTLRERTTRDTEHRIVMQQQLLQAAQRASEITVLQSAILEQETVRNRWEDLRREFSPTQDGFSRIAQSFILEDLLERANEHLRRFSGRYELEAQAGSFAILVKDCYCGGSVRPADMLSGGESFLVSLALALALAKLGDLGSAVDVLFIDEGFDTLDSRTLSQVISTLTMLHSDTRRRIGLISHVELLRESIPMQIAVRRKPGQNGISQVHTPQ